MRSVMRPVSSQGPFHQLQGHRRLKIFVPQKQQQFDNCFVIFAIIITIGDLLHSQVWEHLDLSVPNWSKPFHTDLELV